MSEPRGEFDRAMAYREQKEAWQPNLLQQRIHESVERHGSLRAAARVLKVDHAYLSRLLHGDKGNPNAALLRKLGVIRTVVYVDAKEQG